MDTLFIQHLTHYHPLTESEIAIVLNTSKVKIVEKEEIILMEGAICNHVSFVASGLLMYYKITDTGDEKAYDFALENDWASQYHSMITQTPSPISIRALEKTTLYTIAVQDLQSLYREIPAFESIARQIVEMAFISNIKRTDEFQNLKAEERYANLLQTNPQLLQRVPQYYIASFLGIAPQSLSRIRKKK